MGFFEIKENEKQVDNSLFVEKYRPTKLEDYIGNDHLKEKVSTYIKSNDIPHLLLFGKAGTGKTSLAKLIVKNINCDFIILNASDESGVDTIRNKVKGFVSTVGFKDLKIIILDEFDYMTSSAQAILRNLMETFSKKSRFILTCNYIDKVIEPIRSRCQEFQIIPPIKKDVEVQVINILTKEQIKYDVKDIVPIIDSFYPDIRKIINTVQSYSSGGTLKLDKKSIDNSDFKTQIIDVLKGNNSYDSKYKKIRKIVENSKLKNFTELYSYLYENVDVYGKNQTSSIIVLLSEGQYKESMVEDKKLPFISTIIKILDLLKSNLPT